MATVTGFEEILEDEVTDTDPSHYFGVEILPDTGTADPWLAPTGSLLVLLGGGLVLWTSRIARRSTT